MTSRMERAQLDAARAGLREICEAVLAAGGQTHSELANRIYQIAVRTRTVLQPEATDDGI
jgi:hypothetical protein